MEAMQKIKCLTIEDSNFPDRLRKLSGMPKKLYYIGNLPDPKKPAAAVVGARMCSPYGRCQAFKYARTMASYGCLLYTSDAADEQRGVDLGGERCIKKKKGEDSCDGGKEQSYYCTRI